ncbi:MAG: 50S ribosomal protein L3 [Candidatus Azambacteria bacterium]|nr:50S ribosomal protein L3 [Candidatus Azambacteria bacterium]
MKFLLGSKIGMTQIFDENGSAIAVTLIDVPPCAVTQVRTKERDGYDAVQLGFGAKNKTNKPEKGHVRDLGAFSVLREYRVEGAADKKVGDIVDVSMFVEGDPIRVSGISKAKGFQGVVKRHHFGGGRASHGQKHSEREPGSIGATWPQRVLKGTRMAGRMGGERTTVTGLTVARIDAEHNILAVTGAIPGRRGTLVEIKC